MRLYDTARQEVVPFEPADRVVSMYTCGITPYDSTHLGHAATYLTYDVLQRRLRDLGHETRCVRNITDVDDSILPKARELGVHYLDLAASELARFDADMERLEMLPAWSEPRATSAIPDIRGFIGMVLDRGFAYQAGGSVYFEVSKYDKFGEISNYSREQMLELAAERGGNVEGAQPGQVVEIDGVKIVGYTNVAGRVATSASSLYARNLFSFIETMVDKKEKKLAVNWDDELVKATALTKDGAVIHPNFQPKV